MRKSAKDTGEVNKAGGGKFNLFDVQRSRNFTKLKKNWVDSCLFKNKYYFCSPIQAKYFPS
ncbi:hypothetical protein MASR1M74_15290 [Lentimicrobium sp.]